MRSHWLLFLSVAMAAPGVADEMSAEQARRFVIGPLFAVQCFDETRGLGRIYEDGSVIGTIQLHGIGPERAISLPPGTLKIKGKAVCASIKGLPFDPCFRLERTKDGFRGSVSGLNTAYCIFTKRLDRNTDFARADRRNADAPLWLHPCTAGVEEQC